ncbi:MAG: AMP-binding protein [Clostridia bacterium]|nr:AMP-binding protein [Clostridia bacterium]
MEQEKYFEATEFENIKEIIYNSAKKYGDNTAFVIKHKTDKNVEYEDVSYKRLLEEINALGTKLFELGYKDKRIAIVGRNRYEWTVTHLANLLGGIVSVPLDKELQVDELESCLIRSKADVVVFDEKYIDNIEEIKSRDNTKLQEYICMSQMENYKDIRGLIQEGKELLELGNNEYIDTKIDSYKMNILLFTSGTTSKSKSVMLSQNNIASNIYSMQLVEGIFETDTNLAFLPFHHIFGSTALIVMLACGVKTAFPDGLRYVAQNLKEYKVTLFVGVPLLVEAIYKKVEQGIKKQGKTKIVNIAKKISNILLKFGIDIRRKLFKSIIDELGGHMRFVISGGAPLDKRVAKGFNELGIDLVQGYGLTETSPVIAAENYKKVKYGSIGIPMENVIVEFENKDKNGIGELKVKGPNVMLGYYENAEATKQVLKDGWFYTGDLGYMDKQGYIFITGRKKDMIVLKNGKKVFPEELEILINRLDEVEECMVFGLPDNKDKNDIKLSVKIVYNKEYVNKEYPNIQKEELEKVIWEKVKEINKTFPPYKYIKNMILTDKELIKTTTKKIKRNEEMKIIQKV